MKIEDLTILDAVFREPNLTKIAARFRISQSNLSKILKRIEDELGASLFERKGFQGLKPTAQGLFLAQRVGLFTRSWHDTVDLVKSFDQRRLDVKVTGPELYMRNIFLRRWFKSSLPERFRLTTVEARIDQISLTADTGDIDFAVTPSPIELQDWIPIPVFKEEFALFSASRSSERPSTKELRSRGWVAYHAVNEQIQNFFHIHQISAEQIVAYIEDIESILDILQNNPNLLSILPSHARHSHRKLQAFSLEEKSGQTLFLMHRKGNPTAQIVARELGILLKLAP